MAGKMNIFTTMITIILQVYYSRLSPVFTRIISPRNSYTFLAVGSFHTKCTFKIPHHSDFLQILLTASFGYNMEAYKIWKRSDHFKAFLGRFTGVTHSVPKKSAKQPLEIFLKYLPKNMALLVQKNWRKKSSFVH